MLGWWIVVTDRTPEAPELPVPVAPPEQQLARWESGLGGLDWVTELVRAGRAQQLSFGGYPSRYAVRAGDLSAVLAGGVPHGYGPAAVNVTAELFPERLAALPADRLVTVDAWDQS